MEGPPCSVMQVHGPPSYDGDEGGRRLQQPATMAMHIGRVGKAQLGRQHIRWHGRRPASQHAVVCLSDCKHLSEGGEFASLQVVGRGGRAGEDCVYCQRPHHCGINDASEKDARFGHRTASKYRETASVGRGTASDACWARQHRKKVQRWDHRTSVHIWQ